MRTLSEQRLIDDRAATLEGNWMQRIMDARSANGRYFHSTMTPVLPAAGWREFMATSVQERWCVSAAGTV